MVFHINLYYGYNCYLNLFIEIYSEIISQERKLTMRFTCEKSMLVTGLNIAGRAVAQKSSLSVIEGILCKAGHGLSLTGYNMETAITYQIEADVTDPGKCILPAKLFGDIVRRHRCGG